MEDLDDNGCDFYAMYLAKPVPGKRRKWMRPFSLLYVGLAYHQTVRDRIRQDHDSYHHVAARHSKDKTRNVVVMFGALRLWRRDRRSEALVRDIEALLIGSNQPRDNKKSKGSYAGRDLVVLNTGDCGPLKACVASTAKAGELWQSEGHAEMQTKLALEAGAVVFVVED